MHLLCFLREEGHIALGAARVGGDEVRYELLVESCLAVDTQELFAKTEVVRPVGFAHDFEHGIGAVLGCHFESSGDMSRDELARVLFAHEVIADTRSDEGVLDERQFVHRLQYVDDRPEVLIEVLTDGRLETAGPRT